ncbi:hypothetical protein FDECE_11526 [Fusarium decemcellulare]|nr:hypothetical protein FDECE_11526 [Fusarium decemcellulare]
MPPPVATPLSRCKSQQHAHLLAANESRYPFNVNLARLTHQIVVPGWVQLTPSECGVISNGPVDGLALEQALSYAPMWLTKEANARGLCANSQGEACFRGYPWISIDGHARYCGQELDTEAEEWRRRQLLDSRNTAAMREEDGKSVSNRDKKDEAFGLRKLSAFLPSMPLRH